MMYFDPACGWWSDGKPDAYAGDEPGEPDAYEERPSQDVYVASHVEMTQAERDIFGGVDSDRGGEMAVILDAEEEEMVATWNKVLP